MSKLSAKTTRRITDVIAALDKGLAHLESDNVRVLRLTTIAALPQDTWTSQDGKRGMSIDRQVGSDLCYFRNAREALHRMITPVQIETTP